MQRAGVVHVRGGYIQALPSLLANHLAKSALRGQYHVIEKLFVALKRSARFRLLERLRELDSIEVAHFWDELFSSSGLFAEFQSVLSNIQLLYAIKGAAPNHIARLLERGLNSLSPQERVSIPGDARQYLMSILHDLLFRSSTSKNALRCILLLAESEASANKTGSLASFYDCFHPFQPQCPLPLEDRLDVLRSALSPESSLQVRKIGLRAIIRGLTGGMSFVLHEGAGPEPLSIQPKMIWADIWNYWEALFDLLFAMACSGQSEIAESAQEALPDVLTRYTLFGHITRGLNRFRQVAQWCTTKQIPLSVSRLSGALLHVQRFINNRKAESAEGEETLQNAKQVITDILGLLEAGDFSMRLMRWAGTWAAHEYEEHMEELCALALEAIIQPHLLTEHLLTWLISDEAKLGLPFFRTLGENDTDHHWLEQIEELGKSVKGAGAFSSYFIGLSRLEGAFVTHRLDELTVEGRITGRAIIWATSELLTDPTRVERVERLLEEERVDRVDVEYRLLCYGPWLNTLSIEEYVRILEVTAGKKLEYAEIVVNSLVTWLSSHTDINRTLAEFAWQCLEQVSPTSIEDAFKCDNLASTLVEVDVERSFALLEKRLSEPYLPSLWNPLSPYIGQMFWPALYKVERKRTLLIPLSLAANDTSVRSLIISSLVECINQELDANILIEFASERQEHACVVCGSIAAGKAGFWPIALEIFRHFSSDENVKGRLLYAAIRTDIPRSVMAGLPGVMLQTRLDDVRRVLSEISLSSDERTWLKEIESILLSEKDSFARFEADIDANRGFNIEDDPLAVERLWMLRRLLLKGELNSLQKTITKEEMLTLLPVLQLSETDSTKFEEQIKRWE